MGMKRYLCLLFACIAIFGCIPAQAAAADIGEQAAEIAEPRATGEFDFEISAKSMRKASTSFPTEYFTLYEEAMEALTRRSELTSEGPIHLR